MVIISSREFKKNQKKYFDLVDQNKQVIIAREGRSYLLRVVKEDDRIFSYPEVINEVKKGAEQIDRGEFIGVKKDDIDKYLGL